MAAADELGSSPAYAFGVPDVGHPRRHGDVGRRQCLATEDQRLPGNAVADTLRADRSGSSRTSEPPPSPKE